MNIRVFLKQSKFWIRLVFSNAKPSEQAHVTLYNNGSAAAG